MTPHEVKELLNRPTITPAELIASGILPLKRNGIYDAIKRGKIEVIDLGHRKAVVTASLRRMLGIET